MRRRNSPRPLCAKASRTAAIASLAKSSGSGAEWITAWDFRRQRGGSVNTRLAKEFVKAVAEGKGSLEMIRKTAKFLLEGKL